MDGIVIYLAKFKDGNGKDNYITFDNCCVSFRCECDITSYNYNPEMYTTKLVLSDRSLPLRHF